MVRWAGLVGSDYIQRDFLILLCYRETYRCACDSLSKCARCSSESRDESPVRIRTKVDTVYAQLRHDPELANLGALSPLPAVLAGEHIYRCRRQENTFF
jgi:hypothetical protein